MNAKHVLIALLIVFVLYTAFKEADAVQSIEFQGEIFELSEKYRQSGSTVYLYSPGGASSLRAGKYIQVAHLPEVDVSAEDYRRQFMEVIKNSDGFKKLSENAFFYVEANSAVHSALIQDGDSFKLYGYAEIQSEEQMRDRSNLIADREVARELERTISRLPAPPSVIQTWF